MRQSKVKSWLHLAIALLAMRKEVPDFERAVERCGDEAWALLARLSLARPQQPLHVGHGFTGAVDKTLDFGDPVFKPYVMRAINGVPCAIIGQAFPYTPIANPRYFVPEWTFGIQEEGLQKSVDDARAMGAQVVVLLSHNGMDVDLKLAGRVTGIDAIAADLEALADESFRDLEVFRLHGMTPKNGS